MVEKENKAYRSVALPQGYKFSVCPTCGSTHLIGVMVTPSADEQDPDIMCKNCGKILSQ